MSECGRHGWRTRKRENVRDSNRVECSTAKSFLAPAPVLALALASTIPPAPELPPSVAWGQRQAGWGPLQRVSLPAGRRIVPRTVAKGIQVGLRENMRLGRMSSLGKRRVCFNEIATIVETAKSLKGMSEGRCEEVYEKAGGIA